MEPLVRKSELKLGFWMNRKGSYVSHAKGLTVEQVNHLRSLKPGDRLVLFVEGDKRTEQSPDVMLKKSNLLPSISEKPNDQSA